MNYYLQKTIINGEEFDIILKLHLGKKSFLQGKDTFTINETLHPELLLVVKNKTFIDKLINLDPIKKVYIFDNISVTTNFLIATKELYNISDNIFIDYINKIVEQEQWTIIDEEEKHISINQFKKIIEKSNIKYLDGYFS